MRADDTAIRIKDVSHRFGEEGEARNVRALLDTSFDIARGELLCLIGPSGCGKSTLLNVMGGLLTPTAGTVEVFGKPVAGPMPQDIAFVFQENALFPWNTVSENVDLGMRFQGVPKSERAERARRSLEAVGLKEFADHFPGQLSGGMRQRAALARVLVNDPKILLMDEPFAALDAQTRARLQQEVARLWTETRKTIFFVTHSVEEAILLGDRVIAMTALPGRVKADVRVALPRPRDPTSPEFNDLRRMLENLLTEEIADEVATIAHSLTTLQP